MIKPPSHVRIGNELVTTSAVSRLQRDIDADVETMTIINPYFPLHTIALDRSLKAYDAAIDLEYLFAGTELVELRIDAVGDYAVDLLKSPVLINGGANCPLAERCELRAGRYEIILDPELGLRPDSIKFNDRPVSVSQTEYELQGSGRHPTINTLVFYTH